LFDHQIVLFLGPKEVLSNLKRQETGQFDDQSKFIDGARYDNEEELRDAVMMEKKKKAQKEKKEKEKNYKPAD